MPNKSPFSSRREIKDFFQESDKNPQLHEDNLKAQIERRIKSAIKRFPYQLERLSRRREYTPDELEIHFNCRMEEGLEIKLNELITNGILEKIVDPKTNKVIAYKFTTAEANKDIAEEQPTTKPTVKNKDHAPAETLGAFEADVLKNLGEHQRDLYIFLLQNNPLGISLHLDHIKFPLRYGLHRKDVFLSQLSAAGLAKHDGGFYYTLLKNE